MSIKKSAAFVALMVFTGVASALTNVDNVVGAPEIDPASALSALTLLAGGLTVLRGRRVRKH